MDNKDLIIILLGCCFIAMLVCNLVANLTTFIVRERLDNIRYENMILNNELNVYTEADIRRADKEKVYVTMKEIKSVRTTSAGDISAETGIKTDKLELSASSAGNIKLEVFAKEINVDISSSGDITLKGDADRLDANLSSAGDLKAFDLKVKEADISVSSAGDADINVSDKITARASSAGDINYMGDPKYVDAHASSAGGIHKR